MRSKLVRLVTTFSLIFSATLAIHACGDDNNGLLAALAGLGIPVTLPPGFTTTDLKTAAWSPCEAGPCDGDIADPQTHSWTVTTNESAISVGLTIQINAGALDNFTITSASAVPASIEQQVIACVNTGEAGDGSCSQTSGSALVTASQGSVVITANNPFDDLSTESFAGSWTYNGDITTNDLTSFVHLLEAIAAPMSQDMVNQAIDDMTLTPAAMGGTKTVIIAATVTQDCDNVGGTIDLTQRRQLTIDDNTPYPNVTGTGSELQTIEFDNCELQGNILNVGYTETIVLDGSLTDAINGTTGDERVTGTLQLDTDDGNPSTGNGNPFWSDSANFNLFFPGGGGQSGGVCFGGTVVLDGSSTTDTGDDCSAGADLFFPASEFVARVP